MKMRALFGKPDKRERSSQPRMSPLLQAMARELPRWPPQERQIFEKILIEASAAGVSSIDELSAFLETHPDLQERFSMIMWEVLGLSGNERPFPTQIPEVDQVTIPELGIENLDLSSAGVLESYLAEHPEKSIELNTHALESARTRRDRPAEAFALGELGLAYARLNQLPKAIYYFEHHLNIARELGNWQWEMEDCRNLGRAHLELGESERAISVYKDALLVARQRGDQDWDMKLSLSLASAYSGLGYAEQAEELTDHAFALLNRGAID